jgi:hypothetical protein
VALHSDFPGHQFVKSINSFKAMASHSRGIHFSLGQSNGCSLSQHASLSLLQGWSEVPSQLAGLLVQETAVQARHATCGQLPSES